MSEPMAQVSGLTVQAEREQWQVCGLLSPDADDEPLICGVQFRFVGAAGDDASESGAGLIGWSLDGLRKTGDVDGIPTLSAAKSNKQSSDAPLGLVGIDHLVINTDDLQRTSNSLLESTGSELRRVREVSEEMRQGFHKLGGVVIEIVERRGVPVGASLWGVVLNVADLDRACEWLGPDVVSPPKDAVQEGRRIATIRAIAGLRVPVALMSV